jgi:hypothetical protein
MCKENEQARAPDGHLKKSLLESIAGTDRSIGIVDKHSPASKHAVEEREEIVDLEGVHHDRLSGCAKE